MKNIIIFLSTSFLISGCSTVANYDSADSSSEGVKVNIGSKNGTHVGDMIEVIENRCTESGKGGSRCRIAVVGTMTIIRVEEGYSIAKPDGEITLKQGHMFKLAKHCEVGANICTLADAPVSK